MSKVDAQRAMREAKYARERASGPTRAQVAAAAAGTASPEAVGQPAAAPAGSKARAAKAPEKVASAAAPAAAEGERCGHKSMNGRACTREAGHPEKNHRYS